MTCCTSTHGRKKISSFHQTLIGFEQDDQLWLFFSCGSVYYRFIMSVAPSNSQDAFIIYSET